MMRDLVSFRQRWAIASQRDRGEGRHLTDVPLATLPRHQYRPRTAALIAGVDHRDRVSYALFLRI